MNNELSSPDRTEMPDQAHAWLMRESFGDQVLYGLLLVKEVIGRVKASGEDPEVAKYCMEDIIARIQGRLGELGVDVLTADYSPPQETE